jgi:hypothetical protein
VAFEVILDVGDLESGCCWPDLMLELQNCVVAIKQLIQSSIHEQGIQQSNQHSTLECIQRMSYGSSSYGSLADEIFWLCILESVTAIY